MPDYDYTRIKIGTSGYSYPGPSPKGWYGVFYPKASLKRFDELEFYSQFFNTVEINSTFYSLPSPEMAQAWDRKTRHGFEFSVKVWQKFTHEKKIGRDTGYPEENWESPTHEDVDLFRKGIDPLVGSGKLGVLLMQYPAGFHCAAQSIEKLGWTLRAFKDYPKVVELRHRSWSDSYKLTKGLLTEGWASWALIDEPKFAFSIRQEFEPVGDIFYLRLHGRNYEKWWEHSEAWERYDYLYSQEQIEALAGDLKSVAGQHADRLRKVFVFFNNHARGQAAVNAIMLSHQMGIPIKGVPVEAFVKAFPQISGIFQKPAQGDLF